jgi:hypothetical protein
MPKKQKKIRNYKTCKKTSEIIRHVNQYVPSVDVLRCFAEPVLPKSGDCCPLRDRV